MVELSPLGIPYETINEKIFSKDYSTLVLELIETLILIFITTIGLIGRTVSLNYF